MKCLPAVQDQELIPWVIYIAVLANFLMRWRLYMVATVISYSRLGPDPFNLFHLTQALQLT